jgi:hypothetical protein
MSLDFPDFLDVRVVGKASQSTEFGCCCYECVGQGELSSVSLLDLCCLDCYLSIYIDCVEASLDCVGANLCFGSSQFCKADSVDFI